MYLCAQSVHGIECLLHTSAHSDGYDETVSEKFPRTSSTLLHITLDVIQNSDVQNSGNGYLWKSGILVKT